MNKFLFCLLSFFSIHTIFAVDTFYLDLSQYKKQNRKPITRSKIRHHHRSDLYPAHQHTKLDLSRYSAAQLQTYFTHFNYSESEVLSQNTLYVSDEFVKLAKKYNGYEQAIIALHEQFRAINFLEKLWYMISGDYCPGLDKRIERLYAEIQDNRKKSLSNQQKYTSLLHCQNQLIDALESYNDKTTIIQALNQISQNVFSQAAYSNYSIDTHVEDAIQTSLDILSDTSNPHKFIFHTAFIDYVLCDIEEQITSRKPTLIERSPKLLAQALTTFAKGLNPISQVKNTCEFIVSTAYFVADVTLGKLYLSEQQYQDRINSFWSSCEALSPSNLAQLEAEQWVDLIAQCAADAVFFGGVSKVVKYLKEIGAVNKVQKQATRIADKLKHAIDTSLAERPLVATAEGLIFRATDEMKQLGGTAKEIIGDSKSLLESACKGLLADLEKEMANLRMLCDNNVKDIARFGNKYLKPEYEHILGIDLYFSRRGIPQINGFHHDFMGIFEKTNVFRFVDKVVYENGFYQAKIFYGEEFVKRITFFPSHWSRKQVIEKIYEAYNNFVKAGLEAELRQGKYLIKGFTNEGITIEMHITTSGHIKTAYPTF